MHRFLLLALLAGCAADAPADLLDSQPLDALGTGGALPPPATPADFQLLAPNLVAGEQATYTVIGAPPGATLQVAWSTAGLGPGPCLGSGLSARCLGLAGAVSMAPFTVQADAAGKATFSFVVPASLEMRQLAVQVARLGNKPRISNPTARLVAKLGTLLDPYADADGDGYTIAEGDCFDEHAAISPAAPDTVGDRRDQNCDDADGIDGDRDGHASLDSGGDDCNDAMATVRPGVPEQCDAVDWNCNGDAYDGSPAIWYYRDVDMDGFGDDDEPLVLSCSVEPAYALVGGDCDDHDATRFPGNPEVCDGVDNDCDALTLENTDLDGDGYGSCSGDCDDTDPDVNPGAVEVCDGIDDDCDGALMPDTGYTTVGGSWIGGVYTSFSTVMAISETTFVADVRWRGALYGGGVHALKVYGADNVNGPYTLEKSTGVGVSEGGPGPYIWVRHHHVDLTLEEGRYYVFEVSSPSSGAKVFNEPNGVFPVQAPWGTELGGRINQTGLVDGFTWGSVPSNAVYMDFVVVGETVDADLDGYPACNDCDDLNPTLTPEDFDGDGVTVCDGDCDDGDAYTYPGAPEICDGVDDDCDGETLPGGSYTTLGGPSIGGAPISFTDVFMVDEPIVVDRLRWRGAVYSAGVHELHIYEATGPLGPYTLIRNAGAGTSDGSSPYSWVYHDLGMRLEAGRFYAFEVQSPSSGVKVFNGSTTVWPQQTDWGMHIGGRMATSLLTDGFSWSTVPTTNIYMTLFLADEEDVDGDGYPACEDCDDNDAAVYPGTPTCAAGASTN